MKREGLLSRRRVRVIAVGASVALVLLLAITAVGLDQWFVAWKSDVPELKNPKIVITKSERKLELFDDGELIKTYKVALGSTPVGDKEVEGDGKTPEGEFYIFTKNPRSRFYLSLGVSYPSTDDAKRGLEAELITQDEHDSIVESIKKKEMPLQKTALGGEIYIHGSGNIGDWTEGCIALRNKDMKELYDSVGVRTPVKIAR